MSIATDGTYADATSGCDPESSRALTGKIIELIAASSRVTDANVLALRTSETTEALLHVLATIIAMRPEARATSQLRYLTDGIGKRLRRDVAGYRACNLNFDVTFFRAGKKGGHA